MAKSEKSINVERKSSRLSQKDRHSVTLRTRRKSLLRSSATIAEEESFDTIFKGFCEQFQTSLTPNILTIASERPTGNFRISSTKSFLQRHNIASQGEITKTNLTTLCLIYDNREIDLNSIIMKNSQIDRPLLIALRRTIQKFNSLTTLKLDHCNLTNLNLRTLKTILIKNENIKTISINGNPNNFQNHFILLKNTKLEHLSMRFCHINDRGITLIAAELASNEDQTIASINLSSNFISDVGVDAIADVLRVNRSLISINLSDNWLTDYGCVILMGVLQKFSLRHEEIVSRRHRIIDRLLKKESLIEIQKLKLLQGSDQLSDTSSISGSRKLNRESASKSRRTTKRSQTENSSTNVRREQSNVSMLCKRNTKERLMVEEIVNAQMEPDKHPFVKDSYPENLEIYCKGNFKLLHLNLAYNRITMSGLMSVLDTLYYQQANSTTYQGISHIILEGNDFDERVKEIEEIEDLLRTAHTKKLSTVSNQSETGSRKRSLAVAHVSIEIN